MDNIKNVVDLGLCTGCGTCAGICPFEALRMCVSAGLVIPEIDEKRCTGCGLCAKCCPGYSADFRALNLEFFGVQPKDVFLGNFLGCFVGHSNDYDVRFNSASGGVVTQLLIFALEQGIIDGAIVTRMRRDNPLLPESFIARTKEEIVSASKSKYCPTSPNEVLKQVLKEDGRYAFVGLPCQIHGVRKAEMNVKGLSDKIVLHIGLFCSHTVNFDGTRFLLRKLGVMPELVEEIAYRGCGWPGSMFVKLKNGGHFTFPYVGGWNAYWPIFSSFFFTPLRCLMCLDELNEFADISVGDAWLKEFKGERIGESIIVVRTNIGRKLLESAFYDGVISLEPIDPLKVRKSQAEPLKFKKVDIKARLAMLEASSKKVPDFKFKPFGSGNSLICFARNLFVLFNVKACEGKLLRKLLNYVPFPLFRLYYGVYRLLLLI
ncbi:MAG: Coenzyme F420 hydrogenase/dehydrogenase, beta subunit C-terminal domain [Candidatus Bathyarchaeia archaeon]